MSYTDRILPREEWSKLADTALVTALMALPPDRTSVFVVEDDAGAIVGCWTLFSVLHAEGVWIAPEHRKRTAVARRLWARMRAAVRGQGSRTFVTGAISPEIHALLAKRAVQLPQEYAICLQ